MLTDPLATVELQPSFGEESWISRGVGGNSHASELLCTRWFDVLVSHPPLYVGHAAVVGVPGKFKHELIAARRLREWGYSVQYLSAAGLHREEANDLRRSGVLATVANDIGKALASSGATLVYTEDASAALDVVPHGGQLFVGLSALENSRAASSGTGLTSGAGSSVNDLHMRQVAGL